MGRENYLAAPHDASALAACVGAIRKRLEGLVDDFAAIREFRPPAWHPSPLQGSARFVGRLKELWRIHTGLNPVGISAHEDPHVIVQLVGMGGVGKSLLAIEYAKRFGAAFSGGVYWLRAHGFDPDKPMDAEDRERERRRQIEDIAIAHDIGIKDRDCREVSRDLARKLAADGAPYLWVVDDLPADVDEPEAQACLLNAVNELETNSLVTLALSGTAGALSILMFPRKSGHRFTRPEALPVRG
jgi:hypothetical protein